MSATTNGDANTFSGPLVKVLFLIGSVSVKPEREEVVKSAVFCIFAWKPCLELSDRL